MVLAPDRIKDQDPLRLDRTKQRLRDGAGPLGGDRELNGDEDRRRRPMVDSVDVARAVAGAGLEGVAGEGGLRQD